MVNLPAEVTEDGFSISTQDGILKISGKENGVVYGVVTLLEQYLGIDYWGENEYSLTPSKTVNLPLINKVENPGFRYRQTQCYAIHTDSIYKWWNRLEEPNEVLLPVIGCILLISFCLHPFMGKNIRNIILTLKENATRERPASGV